MSQLNPKMVLKTVRSSRKGEEVYDGKDCGKGMFWVWSRREKEWCSESDDYDNDDNDDELVQDDMTVTKGYWRMELRLLNCDWSLHSPQIR